MFRCLSVLFVSLFLVLGSCVSERLSRGRFERSINRLYRSRLQVNNGMHMGSWGPKKMCPTGTYAAGFSLKVEEPQDFWVGDDTALNGIRLHCKCSSCRYEGYTTVQSDTGSWGEWSDIEWCSNGFLTSFQLRVQTSQWAWLWDETAANNIRFTCSGTGQVLEGSGMPWGDWGDWSETCYGKGICGIRTMVELPGSGDETALNDVYMYCCD